MQPSNRKSVPSREVATSAYQSTRKRCHSGASLGVGFAGRRRATTWQRSAAAGLRRRCGSRERASDGTPWWSAASQPISKRDLHGLGRSCELLKQRWMMMRTLTWHCGSWMLGGENQCLNWVFRSFTCRHNIRLPSFLAAVSVLGESSHCRLMHPVSRAGSNYSRR